MVTLYSLQPRLGKFTLSRVPRQRRPTSMFEYFVYLIYRAGFAVMSFLPLRAAFTLGDALGFGAWLVLGKYRRLALHNIDIAFGGEAFDLVLLAVKDIEELRSALTSILSDNRVHGEPPLVSPP